MKMIYGIFIILLPCFSVQDIKSATGIPIQDVRNCLRYGFYSTYGKIGLGLLCCSAVAMDYGVCHKPYAQITVLVGCVGYMYGIYEGIKTVKSVIGQYLKDVNPAIVCCCRRRAPLTVFYGKPDKRYGKTSIWMRNYKIGIHTITPIAARDEYHITTCDGFIKINNKKYFVNQCSHP